MTKHLINSKTTVAGSSAPDALRNRQSQIDSAVSRASTGPTTRSFVDVLKSGLRDPKKKAALQVQLNTVDGLTSTKNTAVQKLKLRKIRDKSGR